MDILTAVKKRTMPHTETTNNDPFLAFTGYLHIGNLRAARCFNHAIARHGTFILRIDDTDPERYNRNMSTGSWKTNVVGSFMGQVNINQTHATYDAARDALIASRSGYRCFRDTG
jgi:glutamyl/glutaminyl-tRNA synthetase